VAPAAGSGGSSGSAAGRAGESGRGGTNWDTGGAGVDHWDAGLVDMARGESADEPTDPQDISVSDRDSHAQDSPATEAPPEDGDAARTVPKVCAQPCAADEDCSNETGVESLRCHPTTHRCATCLDDILCVARRSLWTGRTCTTDATCVNDGGFAPFGDVCVDIDGTGYCAFLATSTANCTSFLNTTMFSTFTVKKYGSSEMVDVCGKSSRCDADRGSCQNPCTSNTSCTPLRGGKTCNTGLGRCECASDADCGPGAPTCNLTIRQCECSAEMDCSTDTGRRLACQ